MRFLPLVLIGGAVTWYFLRMRNMGQNIQFVLRSIRVKGGSIIQPNIIITLGIQNPTNQPAIVRSMSGVLTYEGKIFANWSNFETTTIKENSESLLAITAIPNLLGVTKVLSNIIINKQRNAVIEMTGTANINNISVPVNSSFRF